jgi:hypothetical protein
MTHGWGVVALAATVKNKSNTPTLYALPMSSWEDHEQMIDDQYLMESIEEDQKLTDGDLDEEDEDFEDEEE